MGRLDGKTALITGAANGMGEAAARLFADEGAKVIIADMSDRGLQVAAEIGEGARYQPLDVTSEDNWVAAIGEGEKAFGPISILINNAGVFGAEPLVDITRAEFDRMVNVNQYGVLLGMRMIVPSMRKAGSGSIVNMSSASAKRGVPGNIVYASTKWAVRGMTLSAVAELAPHGIRVNALYPGVISGTEMFRQNSEERVSLMAAYIPFQRLGVPIEVAQVMLFLASDDSSYLSGAEIAVDGGLMA
jgi:3alpha(or 20beta)-hydroxysteroid dehydrogenase